MKEVNALLQFSSEDYWMTTQNWGLSRFWKCSVTIICVSAEEIIWSLLLQLLRRSKLMQSETQIMQIQGCPISWSKREWPLTPKYQTNVLGSHEMGWECGAKSFNINSPTHLKFSSKICFYLEFFLIIPTEFMQLIHFFNMWIKLWSLQHNKQIIIIFVGCLLIHFCKTLKMQF